MEGDDYVGHCVNVAARLCDLASAGEALALRRSWSTSRAGA